MTALRKIDPADAERRRHARIPVALKGRLMLEAKSDFECQIIDMSLGGVQLKTRARGQVHERVVAYVDHFGRLQGTIARTTPEGFAVKLDLPAAKRERVAELLTWVANRAETGTPEDRCHARIVPANVDTTLELVTGRQCRARIIDFSRSGVAIAVDTHPALGARVAVGRTTGTVIRHFETGIAVEYLRLIPSDRFDEFMIL